MTETQRTHVVRTTQVPLAGTKLEFIVFENSYDDAWDRGYRGLTGANRYNVDYSILGGTRVEPVLREIRNEMAMMPAMDDHVVSLTRAAQVMGISRVRRRDLGDDV
jgi:hypothetical protein